MSDPVTFPWAEFVKAAAPLGTFATALVGAGVALRIHNDKKRHDDKRDEAANTREMKLASVVAALHLAVFVRDCISVAHDKGLDEYGQPAGGGDGRNEPERAPTTTTPKWSPGDLKVEWKYINAELTDQLFELSMQIDDADADIAGVAEFDDPPDYPHYFRERRLKYAELGIRAFDLRSQLLQGAGIQVLPKEDPNDCIKYESAVLQQLNEVIDEINALDDLVATANQKPSDILTQAQVPQPSGNAADGAGAQAPHA